MTERPRHLIVVNGQRVDLLERLAEASAARLSVITESASRSLYPEPWDPHTVESFDDLGEVLSVALAVGAAHGPVDGVVALSERSLVPGAYLRDQLGLPGPRTSETIGFVNKHAMKQRLRAAGLPVCDWELVPTVAALPAAVERIGPPALVKPVTGIGAFLTHPIDDPADAAPEGAVGSLLVDHDGPLLVERRADVIHEYHCDGLVQEGRVVQMAPSRYFGPLLSMLEGLLGSSTLMPDDPVQPALARLHRGAVEALGMSQGVTHLEVFELRDGSLVIGEIACRPGGGGVNEVLQAKFGFDTHADFFSAAQGLPTPAADGEPEGDVFGWCRLPVRPGRLEEISAASDLAVIEGVLDARVTMAPGDEVETPVFSTTSAGMVLFRARDEAGVRRILAEIDHAYVWRSGVADPAPTIHDTIPTTKGENDMTQEAVLSDVAQQIRERGFATVPGVLSAETVARLREICTEYLPEDDKEAEEIEASVLLQHPELAAAIFNTEVTDCLRELLGGSLTFYPNYVVRLNRFTTWHVDNGFLPAYHDEADHLFDPEFAHLQCVLYLQDNVEGPGGGLDVSARSHRWAADDVEPDYDRLLETYDDPESIPSKAGDLLVFDGRLIHRGSPTDGSNALPKFGIFFSASRSDQTQVDRYTRYLGQRAEHLKEQGLGPEKWEWMVRRYEDVNNIRFPGSYHDSTVEFVREQGIDIAEVRR